MQKEYDDLKRRLAALEQENARLRKAPSGKRETVTVAKMFKGNPVLMFEGQFKPFGIGLKKAMAILEKLDDVRFFVENNKHKLSRAADHDETEAA